MNYPAGEHAWPPGTDSEYRPSAEKLLEMYKTGEADGSKDIYLYKGQVIEVKDGVEQPSCVLYDARWFPFSSNPMPRINAHQSTAYGPVAVNDFHYVSNSFFL